MERRKKTLVMMMAAGAALAGLTGCSSDDGALGADATGQGMEIRLASTVGTVDDEVVTRSYNATNLQSGDTCYVWADMVNATTGEQSEYFKAWTLIANGSGGLSPQVSGNAKLFPATNALNFYAMAGNFGTKEVNEQEVPKITDGETALPTTGIAHTVMANQTTPTAYYKSDLLYAVKKNQEPISEAVQLPFKHLLSRIQVVLVAGNGLGTNDLSGATVQLVDLWQQVTFCPDSTKSFASATDLAGMLSIPTEWAAHGNITLATQVIDDDAMTAASAPGSTVYADAIIVPQTVAADAQLIKVSYLGRDTYYTVPTGGMTFESGKQYRFRLIADRIGNTYLAKPEISDWTVLDATPMNLTY